MCFDDPRPEMGDGNREWAAEKGNITTMAQNDIGIDLGTTTIIIAQRVASVSDADRIIVLSDGRIDGIGTHDELMAKENGAYKNLYEAQFKSK